LKFNPPIFNDMPVTKKITLFLLIISFPSLAQTNWLRLEGRIIDSRTQAPVPYVSIAIENSKYGTSSNEDGAFTLNYVPDVNKNPQYVILTSIGYQTARFKTTDNVSVISLNPSTIELKEVTVHYRDPAQIVRKAFSRIKKNYYTKPFLYKSFYRHYCKDDTTYGRLIEAAVHIYKRKGYKLVQPSPGYKEEVRAVQLRRSFDNTNVKENHQPIALYSVMGVDPVAYQVKSASSDIMLDFFMNTYRVSTLKKRLKDYEFHFDGVTTYDDADVYKINYSKKENIVGRSGIMIQALDEGTLYISTKDFAIIRSEYRHTGRTDTTTALTIYKKYNGLYFHHYTMKEGSTFYPNRNFTHTYHLELMTSEIVLSGFDKFTGKEPNKGALLMINYDSLFWKEYNILKATPLQDKIASHLERELSLDNQYDTYLKQERERYFGGEEDEENFNKFLAAMKGVRPVYISFWQSDCEPCIKQIARTKKIFDLYKTRVSFVFVSLDDDIDLWNKFIKRNNLNEPAMKHFRIGSHADAVYAFTISEIPRYIIIDKAGAYANLNAKPPTDFNLIKDLEALLAEERK
jgi:hypothetical protein